MGDDDRGGPARARVTDHRHHGLAVRRVEGSRRLVRQEEVALTDHGASDRHPLALAAGELIGVVPRSVGKPEPLERRESRRMRFACRDAVELEGQCDVLRRGEAGEEVEVLEDVTDAPPPEPRLVVAGQPGQRRPANAHLATCRLLEASGDGEKR